MQNGVVLYKNTLDMYMQGGCMNNVGYKLEHWTQKLKSHHCRFVQQRMAAGWLSAITNVVYC